MARRIGWTAVLLVAALAAACGRATPIPDSGVEGNVWVGPLCPVVQEGVPCPDAPLEAELEVVDGRGGVVARGRSGADGAYRIALPAGDYTLIPLSPNEAGLPWASPQAFTVEAGAWVILDVHYDSGIR